MTPTDGHNLIFLISQPRSGSTLLQHLLGSHPLIGTTPEPWLMLPWVYALRPQGIETDFNFTYAFQNTREFLQQLPDGEQLYRDAIRDMALRLYESALAAQNKKLFLDKSPRYYFIIPDLCRLFPQAKFIFLVRNPMAVLSSMLETNFKGDWRRLYENDRLHDLLSAPQLILAGLTEAKERAALVNYESLISDPEGTLTKLCKLLKIDFDLGMVNYGDKVHFSGASGFDRKSIYQHERPVDSYVQEWVKRLDAPQKLHVARWYLAGLGPKVVDQLGYSYETLRQTLDSIPLSRDSRQIPWKLLSTPTDKLSSSERRRLFMMRSLLEDGWWRTVQRFGTRMLVGRRNMEDWIQTTRRLGVEARLKPINQHKDSN